MFQLLPRKWWEIASFEKMSDLLLLIEWVVYLHFKYK